MTEDDVLAFLTSITAIADQLRDLDAYEADMIFAQVREALADREAADGLSQAILSGVRLGHRSARAIQMDLPS